MSWVSSLALYLIVWWVTLFLVLPFGVRSVGKPEKGHDAGAPERSRLRWKLAITTLIAALLWAAVLWVIRSGLVPVRGFYDGGGG